MDQSNVQFKCKKQDKCNKALPRVPHSLYTNELGSFPRKQSAVWPRLFISCGHPTASASRSDLEIKQKKNDSYQP